MNAPLRALIALFAAGAMAVAVGAQGIATEEISVGFLPKEWVTAALQKTLSPQARATFVSTTGPVRISDAGERIAAARSAIAELQKAPALVPIAISFATMAQREVQRLPAEPPALDYGIPVPDHYDPPRILAGAGGVVVVPAQPRNFTTRKLGAGAIIDPSPGSLTETETTSSIARRFSVSTVLGKSVLATVLRQTPDVAALRGLAVKYRAIANNEPAWSGAGTELQFTPEPAGAAVMIKVVPQIVLAPAAPGQAPRRIPIHVCTAGVMIAPGAQTQTGTLPGTDPEFYRIFLGTPQAGADTFTSMTLSANVQYIGNPPQ